MLFGLNSTFSVATERTVWSLPEIAIGGMPDVGVIFHMNKLGDNLGTMLALTGQRLKGTDVFHSGISTHFCKSERLDELKREIAILGEQDLGSQDLARLLDKFHEDSTNKTMETEKAEKLAILRGVTSQVYDSESILDILGKLRSMEDDWSRKQLNLISKACPLSLR